MHPQIAAATSQVTAPAISIAATPSSLPSAASAFPCSRSSHGGRPTCKSIAADSLLADVGALGSNNVVAVINADNVQLADLAVINANVVALANLHAAALPGGLAGNGPRSAATEDYVEPPPGSPAYSSDSDALSVEVTDGWDAESAANSHVYENEVDAFAALGASRSDPQRPLELVRGLLG